MQTTSLHLPSDLLYILRIVAVSRANRRGGRPSVSDVVREFLELHRRQFEVEASGPSNRAMRMDKHSGDSARSAPSRQHADAPASPRERRASKQASRSSAREWVAPELR